MVCLGNICRSPLAEGILRRKSEEKGLNWTIDSAGTGYWHVGNAPDSRSVAVAKKYGTDIAAQKARQFVASDFLDFDLILVMDKSNLRNVLSIGGKDAQPTKVKLILAMVPWNSISEVPDPYYDDNGFEAVYQMLDRACDYVIRELVTRDL